MKKVNPDQVINIITGLSDLSKRIQEAHADEKEMEKKRAHAWQGCFTAACYKKKK